MDAPAEPVDRADVGLRAQDGHAAETAVDAARQREDARDEDGQCTEAVKAEKQPAIEHPGEVPEASRGSVHERELQQLSNDTHQQACDLSTWL